MEGLIFRPLQQPPRICLLPPDLSGWLRNQKCSHNHMVPNHICSHKLLIKLEIHCVLRRYCSTWLAVVTTCIEHWYTMETSSHDGDTVPVVCRGNCLTTRHVLRVKPLVFSGEIEYLQGVFFNWSARFSVPKWKNLLSRRGAFLHWKFREKLVLVGCNLFFIVVLKIGRTS